MGKLISAIVLLVSLFALPAPAVGQASRDTGTVVNDAWITTQVYAKFFMDPDIKGRNITVETMSGVVTLTGTVQSGAERNQAVTKAKTTDTEKLRSTFFTFWLPDDDAK